MHITCMLTCTRHYDVPCTERVTRANTIALPEAKLQCKSCAELTHVPLPFMVNMYIHHIHMYTQCVTFMVHIL